MAASLRLPCASALAPLPAGSVSAASPSRVTLRPVSVPLPRLSRPLSPSALRSDFAAASRASPFFASDFSGSALLPSVSQRTGVSLGRPSRLVVRAGGTSLGCTKRHASRKKRARVSGYRVRIATADGINVLKRRRAKGRKVLVPQSSSRSGKRA